MVGAVLCGGRAEALVINFDTLPEGKIVASSDLPSGYGLTVHNDVSTHPQKAIIFDSACPPGGVPQDCSGEDDDLKTPGVGIGNNTAQNKILIIAEDVVDVSPADGLVDDPDDERSGGYFYFTFAKPTKVRSVRFLDIDANESASIKLYLTDGSTRTISVPGLGNNSAQTIQIPAPIPNAKAMKVTLSCSSGGIDDIVTAVCGNNVLEPGEQCDKYQDAACPGHCGCDCKCNGPTTTTTTTVCKATTTTIPDTKTTLLVTTTTVPDTKTTLLVTTTTVPETTTTLPPTTTTTTIPKCGDNVVNQTSEQCDGLDATDCSGQPCLEDCTCPVCGDGVVEGNEQCEPAETAPSACGGKPCLANCRCPVCGNGIIEPGEICDPPSTGDCGADCRLAACPTNTEICNNGVDDNNNQLVDCADPQCPVGTTPPCGCVPIRRDPAEIRFDATNTGKDFFSIHGRFKLRGDLDLDNARFAILLMNESGRVYHGTLAAGELHRKVGGKGRYVFRDNAARNGGPGDADGLYRVGTRVLESDGVNWLHFRIKAYGDFSAATVAKMTTQVIAGDDVGALTAEWKQIRDGWMLRTGLFEEQVP